MRNIYILVFSFVLPFFGCSTNEGDSQPGQPGNITIFHINDSHAQLDNFAKIKHIVDEERLKTNVIVVSSGDLFSGNPVVDNYEEKGYPLIDVMNEVGFDVAALGNHEFDYGELVLKDHIEQSEFGWVCANVDVAISAIQSLPAYASLHIDQMKITFLGLVETNGKENATIPSTHPLKVQNFVFERPENVVTQYAQLKEQENADLFVVLSHLGYNGYGGQLGDYQLATEFPYFDLIIGGHSHQKIDTVINNIPVVQAGSNLNYLGKIEISVRDRKIESFNYQLIDLNTYTGIDTDLKTLIEEYDELANLNEVIGFSHNYHGYGQVGCFYTDALRLEMDVDVSFQNTGGIRSSLDKGDITKREIYEITPFNNGTMIYEMTVSDVKTFLKETGSGFYYSGIQIIQVGSEIDIKDMNGNRMEDRAVLSVGLNDYIPAVHDAYFPDNGEIQALTDAETLISYLENVQSEVDYAGCNRYFRYQ